VTAKKAGIADAVVEPDTLNGLPLKTGKVRSMKLYVQPWSILIRFLLLQAKWMSFWAPAGQVFYCMKQSVMAWKVTLTGKNISVL
jgi:hypothetical protein